MSWQDAERWSEALKGGAELRRDRHLDRCRCGFARFDGRHGPYATCPNREIVHLDGTVSPGCDGRLHHGFELAERAAA